MKTGDPVWSEKPLDVKMPLRPDFVATITIPRDFNQRDAERLAAFVKTLGQPGVSDE